MPRAAIKTKHKIVARIDADLLKHVRKHNGLSRVELARALNLAPSTAGIYVERLKKKGFLIEGERVERRHGRRPTLLMPNPDSGRFVGVDFEAHSLMTMVVDFSLQTVSRSTRPIAKGDTVERILKKIEESIHAALKDDPKPLLGVGVGVPGVLDVVHGTASSYEFIEGWKNIPVASLLATKFDAPVHVENNIRCMALAELWLGQGRGLRNFLCLGVRTGTSVGIVLEGELFRGSHGGAGEIGNWPAAGITGKARAGTQTLEAAVSLDTVLAAASKATGREMDMAALRSAVGVGDRNALKVLEDAASVHGGIIRQLYFLFDPERIIVAGPLAELGAAYLTPLAAAADLRLDAAAPLIVNSAFGQFGGALGAAALALHRWKPVYR